MRKCEKCTFCVRQRYQQGNQHLKILHKHTRIQQEDVLVYSRDSQSHTLILLQ